MQYFGRATIESYQANVEAAEKANNRAEAKSEGHGNTASASEELLSSRIKSMSPSVPNAEAAENDNNKAEAKSEGHGNVVISL